MSLSCFHRRGNWSTEERSLAKVTRAEPGSLQGLCPLASGRALPHKADPRGLPGVPGGRLPCLERPTDLRTEPSLLRGNWCSSVVMYKCFTYTQERWHSCPPVLPQILASGPLSLTYSLFSVGHPFLYRWTLSKEAQAARDTEQRISIIPSDVEALKCKHTSLANFLHPHHSAIDRRGCMALSQWEKNNGL